MAYLLFAGNDYYPRGGARDLVGRFDTIEAAIGGHDPRRFKYDGGWANVLCLETLAVVKRFSRGKWYEPGADEDEDEDA